MRKPFNVILPGQGKVPFDTQEEAFAFIRNWNNNVIERCQCDSIELKEVKEMPEKGSLQRPVSGISYYSGKVLDAEFENLKNTQSVI